MNIWRVLDLRSHSCSNSPVDSLVLLLWLLTYDYYLSIVLWFLSFAVVPFALNFWNHHLNTDRQFQWWPCTFQEGHQQKGRELESSCRVQKEIWLLEFWKHVLIRIAKVNGYTSHTTNCNYTHGDAQLVELWLCQLTSPRHLKYFGNPRIYRFSCLVSVNYDYYYLGRSQMVPYIFTILWDYQFVSTYIRRCIYMHMYIRTYIY